MNELLHHLVTLEYDLRKLKNAMRYTENTCDMEQTVIDIEVAIAHLIESVDMNKHGYVFHKHKDLDDEGTILKVVKSQKI